MTSATPVAIRFARLVERGPGCWLWKGARQPNGYGRFSAYSKARKTQMAHRWAWILANGPIPDGMRVLHRCDNPPCVNPAHLFLGTDSDNMRDCVAKGRHFEVRKTHCKHGHPLSGDNLVSWASVEGRRCATCERERRARYPRHPKVPPTHCKHGHDFTPENTRVYLSGGYWKRGCLECRKNEPGRRKVA